VWSFHEAKLDVEDVKRRLSRIERAVLEARKIVYGGTTSNHTRSPRLSNLSVR
jgi:hypothetical protein